ncbi:acyltransferase [Escherichia coli]|nr:acyltransferase [Escherichia coli]EFB6316074.1 acyltransferase [Escherichia coli]EHK6196118.1 acyltransferase [Escherichia coli]ELA5553508.1 acyltransferase [Escherichia coli]HAH9214965.1 acyltransferase [Escherichia coli]
MNNKITSLQILRGIAALSVVLYHYNLYLVPNGLAREIPDKLFGWGAIGVDLFFVISGFIMVYVTHRKPYGFKTSINFIINRVVRVLPTYYAILFITIFCIGGIDIILNINLDNDPNFASALMFNPYIPYTAPLYIPDSGLYNIRWTLNYEMYFYIAFAVCLLFKPRLALLAFWFLLPVAFAVYATDTFTMSTRGYEFELVKLRFITNPIILEFGIGVLTGYAYLRLHDNKHLKSGVLCAALTLTIIVGISLGYLRAYSLISATAFSFLVLLFSIQSDEIIKRTPKIFVTLGNISFSWYLIHTPLLFLASLKFDKYYPGAINSFSGFGVLLALSIILAWISHRFIEVSLTSNIKRFIDAGLHYKSKS